MSNYRSSKNQTIIKVQDREIPFFENFTKNSGIFWSKEQKDNGLLILSASLVGYIVTPYRTIKLPVKYSEITFEHVLRMYLYLYTFRKNDDAKELDISPNSDDLDITKSFFRLLRKETSNGILREYKPANIHEKVVTGHVNWNKTLYNIKKMSNSPITTTKFSLSTDNPINRLIVGALTKLTLSNKYSSTATGFLEFFRDVKNPVKKNGAKHLQNIVFNSNTNRYRKLLNYASMIIDNTDYNDMGKNTSVRSFLLNFDALYEDFVIKILTEESHVQGFSTWNGMHALGHSSTFGDVTYQPDILFKYQSEDPNNDYKEHAYGVLDCKNKAYSIFKNADIYQIVSYSRKLNSNYAILLYPSFEDTQPAVLNLDYDLFSPASIYAAFINISKDSGEDFLKSIKNFAKTVVSILQYD